MNINMKFIAISKFLMIAILPILLLLFFFNYYGFDDSFYQQKFSEYNVQQSVPNAASLHEKVFDFIEGKSDVLPNVFNEREKKHLWDVRLAVKASKTIFYALLILFFVLMSAALIILKIKKYALAFAGKVLAFGGFLTLLLSAFLFLSLSYDFSGTFEGFHKLFFKSGTYLFNPEKEVIVNLYPEKFFMDLGVRISKGVILSAAAIMLLGAFLLLKPKRI